MHEMKPHMKNRAVTVIKAKRLLDRAGCVVMADEYGVFDTDYNPILFPGRHDRDLRRKITGRSSHQQVRLHRLAGIKH
jgi:hypothetical protein